MYLITILFTNINLISYLGTIANQYIIKII